MPAVCRSLFFVVFSLFFRCYRPLFFVVILPRRAETSQDFCG
jgi:hypothetical protein